MALSDRSIKLGIKYDQGIDFTEYTGYWPMPETCGGVVKILDNNNNVRILVLDFRDGRFYDIAMREGPGGSYVTNEFKDKVETDGTGGFDIEPEIRFKEDTGEYEKFLVEHDTSRFYVRPYDERNRDVIGYDSNGYPQGIEFTAEIYADGVPDISTASAKKIPVTGEIVYDKKVEGHRLQTVFKANKSGFKLVGRQQDYIVKDINETPDIRVLNEGLCQQVLSNVYRRITRSNPLIEKITKYTIGGVLTTGPDNNDTAVLITESVPLFTLPSITSTTDYYVFVWIKKTTLNGDALFSTPDADLNVIVSEYEINGYVLCYGEWQLDSGFSGELLTINIDEITSLFDFRLVKKSTVATIDDVLEYMYKDGSKNNFDNICPVVF